MKAFQGTRPCALCPRGANCRGAWRRCRARMAPLPPTIRPSRSAINRRKSPFRRRLEPADAARPLALLVAPAGNASEQQSSVRTGRAPAAMKIRCRASVSRPRRTTATRLFMATVANQPINPSLTAQYYRTFNLGRDPRTCRSPSVGVISNVFGGHPAVPKATGQKRRRAAGHSPRPKPETPCFLRLGRDRGPSPATCRPRAVSQSASAGVKVTQHIFYSAAAQRRPSLLNRAANHLQVSRIASTMLPQITRASSRRFASAQRSAPRAA